MIFYANQCLATDKANITEIIDIFILKICCQHLKFGILLVLHPACISRCNHIESKLRFEFYTYKSFTEWCKLPN